MIRIFLLLLGLIASPGLAADQLNIAVGESSEFQLEEFANAVNLDDRGVVDVARGKNKSILIITGRKTGHSTIEVTLKSGKGQKIFVSVTDPGVLRARLESARIAIGAIRGLSATIKKDKVIASGKITTRGDLQKLEGIKATYRGLIIDGTDQNLPKANTVVTTINRVLNQNDIGNIQAHAYGKIFVLEGTPKSKEEAELAMRIAALIAPDIEDRMEKSASAAPSVAIEIMFVEVQKSNMKAFGLKEAGKESGGIGQFSINPVSGQNGRLNWQIGPLSRFLDLIQETGASRVLSNPKLIARSGEKANFHSGGTIFVPVSEVTAQGRESKLFPVNYGIELVVEPKIDRLGQIDAKIKTTVSDRGEQTGDEAAPTLSISNVQTAVSLKNGQSILLSGLVSKHESKSTERVPLLADIPIVGELFKHRHTHKKEAELLVLVTMSRVHGSDERDSAVDSLWQKGAQSVDVSFFD